MNNPTIWATIFDLDGVVSDTQCTYSQIESELLRECGITISPDEITRRYSGVDSRSMMTEVFELSNKPLSSIEEILLERRRRVRGAFEKGVREIPGTREYVEKLRRAKMPIAIASGSSLASIDLILTSLKLQDHFPIIASCEEVEQSKPAPDVFLLAAERLGVAPQNCSVIEDGINGMIAARRAGMHCVGLVREGNFTDYPADIHVRDLRELL